MVRRSARVLDEGQAEQRPSAWSECETAPRYCWPGSRPVQLATHLVDGADRGLCLGAESILQRPPCRARAAPTRGVDVEAHRCGADEPAVDVERVRPPGQTSISSAVPPAVDGRPGYRRSRRGRDRGHVRIGRHEVLGRGRDAGTPNPWRRSGSLPCRSGRPGRTSGPGPGTPCPAAGPRRRDRAPSAYSPSKPNCTGISTVPSVPVPATASGAANSAPWQRSGCVPRSCRRPGQGAELHVSIGAARLGDRDLDGRRLTGCRRTRRLDRTAKPAGGSIGALKFAGGSATEVTARETVIDPAIGGPDRRDVEVGRRSRRGRCLEGAARRVGVGEDRRVRRHRGSRSSRRGRRRRRGRGRTTNPLRRLRSGRPDRRPCRTGRPASPRPP